MSARQKHPPCRCERFHFPHRADRKCAALKQAREDSRMSWVQWSNYAHRNNLPLFGYSEP